MKACSKNYLYEVWCVKCLQSGLSKTQIADSSLSWVEGCTFPTERNQSLTSAYMGQQGRLFVFHYVDHQLNAKSEAGDEHISL